MANNDKKEAPKASSVAYALATQAGNEDSQATLCLVQKQLVCPN